MVFAVKRQHRPHVAGFYNFNGKNLLRWRIGVEAVKAGIRNAKIICLGDSTTEGYGATANGHQSNAKSQAYPTQLAALLPNTNIDNFLCDQFVQAAGFSVEVYDTRIVKTSGTWAQGPSPNYRSLGGACLFSTSASGILSFTPANAFDTVEVHYEKVSTTYGGTISGSFTIDVDGGAALATVNAAVAALGDNQGISTQTCALATHTVNITQVSNGVYINGIVCYNSASKKVLVMNAGWQGSVAANFRDATLAGSVAAGFLPLLRIRDLAADLLIYMETINDWNAVTSPAAYVADMQTVLTTQLANGDAMLISGFPSNPATKSSLAIQKTYVEINKKLAFDNGIPFLNLWELFGGNWGASGFMVDDLHPNVTGYGRLASYVNQALAAGFRS